MAARGPFTLSRCLLLSVLAGLAGLALGKLTKGVPMIAVSSFTTQRETLQDIVKKNKYVGFGDVKLNAALTANVSIDGEKLVPQCGLEDSINITGSIFCLEEYRKYAGRLGRELPFDAYKECPGYQIAFPCKGETPSSDSTIVPVSSDLGSLIDNNFSTTWARTIEEGKPVTLTLNFPEPFKIASLLLALETIPVKVIVKGSLNGGTKKRLITFQLEACPTNDFYCWELRKSNSKGRVVIIDLAEYIGAKASYHNVDKLFITFDGSTSWKEYAVNYLVIRELHVEATCACKKGSCSADIIESLPRSKTAGYSCKCPSEDLGGFECDMCVRGFYNDTDSCTACGCGYGAAEKACSAEGVCQCNHTLYDNPVQWDKKCELPYITNISPRSGPLSGGTKVTITGGLLTQLNLTGCVTEACDSCPDRDARVVCITKADGALGSTILVTALDRLGKERNFTFTYYEITGLSPTEAFATGGRALTLTGTDLSATTKIALGYRFTCLVGTQQTWTGVESVCRIFNSSVALCDSVNFCNITNECSDKGVNIATADFCLNGNRQSIGATANNVNIQIQVIIDNHIIPLSNITSSFQVRRDPVIFAWEKALKTIQPTDMTFIVPGEHLNSGATVHDYKVVIDGVVNPSMNLTATSLTVHWPHDTRPVGRTLVSVGLITKDVGTLTLDSLSAAVIAGPIVAVLVVLCVICIVVVVLRRRKRRLSIEKNIHKQAYKPGNVRYVKRNGELAFIPLGHLISDTELLNELKPFLIDKERLSLSTQLGSGQFGKVFKGTIQFNDGRQTTVAAKTLKLDSGVTEEIVSDFLKEATLMSNFHHHNVLTLIGVVYSEGNMPVVVLPYMHRGDIRSLVHSDDEVLVLGDLLHFAMQIARGMEYLAERRFVHRDIAARNCMVDNDYVVKIADFGLSRDIYEDDYYRSDESSSKPLPVKWMAIESLNTGKFSVQTDVWSYGVVMWELLTRGVTPYPSISNYEIKTHLNVGQRLSQPQYCPDIIYDMMYTCWLAEPSSRPTFTELADKLASILEDSNYQERAKTKKIESDYYLQPVGREELAELYIQVLE